jgi:glutathione S-transferase
MKLYVTYTSPYARLARIVAMEKALEDRVEIIEAKTRTLDSPYYQINPSGRVPYLVDDAGCGMEDSQLICAYLDSLDGKPRFHRPRSEPDWAYLRLEFMARSVHSSGSPTLRKPSITIDGVCVVSVRSHLIVS